MIPASPWSGIELESTPAKERQLRTSESGAEGLRAPRSRSLVALTNDEELLEALESVLANERRLRVVDLETELASALRDPRVGVALIDADKLQSPLAEFTHRLRIEYPGVVLVVAGGPDEQAVIANQVASGEIYRFLHKPVSEQRVKLFIEAALRHQSAGTQREPAAVGGAAAAVTPLVRSTRLPAAIAVGAAAILLTVIMGAWELFHTAPAVDAGGPRAPAGSRAPALPRDARLAKANAALARGELVTPVGASAAELFAAILRDAPDDPDAREGLGKVIDQLCSLAEREVAAGRLEEATRYLESARRLDANQVRVAFLTTEIAKERERATASASRAAARARAAAEAAAKAVAERSPEPPAEAAAVSDTPQ